jgi:hypothetical protein
MNIMKKGIICVLVCMLMIASTVVSVSGTVSTKDSSQTQYSQAMKILNTAKIKLDAVNTKQEALAVVKEIIVELNDHGLLPKGMSIRQAQRLITIGFLKSELVQPFQSNYENNSGNTNCLVIGIANGTYFRPYPALVMDIPFLYNLAFNSSLRNITQFLALPYVIRTAQPLKLGPYAYVGSRFKLVEHGNTTEDLIQSSSGWVWTIGSNGSKKWNGTFYGGLFTKYKKIVYNNYTSAETWDPVGIRGFVGINFFNFITSFGGNRLPSIYIGFAREVNFTYSYPWS